MTREELGRVVADAAVRYWAEQGLDVLTNDELDDDVREAGCVVGETVAAAVQRWIPVAERMPVADQGVLIWRPDWDEPEKGWIDEDGDWAWGCDCWAYADQKDKCPTHWQPLPEPPGTP